MCGCMRVVIVWRERWDERIDDDERAVSQIRTFDRQNHIQSSNHPSPQVFTGSEVHRLASS